MKKLLLKIAVVGSLVLSGFTMTGCTDFERGLAAGAAVGVVGTVAANNNSYAPRRTSIYRRGYRNGCTTARGRWIKSRYYWNNYRSYRNGWRAGRRDC